MLFMRVTSHCCLKQIPEPAVDDIAWLQDVVLYPMVIDTEGIARAKILGLIPCFKSKKLILIRKGLIHFACSQKEKWKKYSLTT